MFVKHIPFFALFLVIFFGCAKKLPDGMPKLYPVTISVTQEDNPFTDASVSLRYLDTSIGTWAIGGVTNANGNVALMTNGYPGAPVGKFKVVLIKLETEGKEEHDKAMAQAMERRDYAAVDKLRAKLKIFSCVRAEYNDPEKTPLEVEITEKTKTLSIDAGPAVKIRQTNMP